MTMATIIPKERRPVFVAYRGELLKAEYRPRDILLCDMDGAEADPTGTARRLILSCLASWNVESGGQRYPITEASIRILPDKLVLDLAVAITADLRVILAAARVKGAA
jgi:hypothetical protein